MLPITNYRESPEVEAKRNVKLPIEVRMSKLRPDQVHVGRKARYLSDDRPQYTTYEAYEKAFERLWAKYIRAVHKEGYALTAVKDDGTLIFTHTGITSVVYYTKFVSRMLTALKVFEK